jgi:hypothetical protein
MNIPGTTLVTKEDLANMAFPKLFLIAEEDTIPDWPTFVSDFVEMYDHSPEPKELIIYPGQTHGTGLFLDHGEELRNKLLKFLNTILAPSASTTIQVDGQSIVLTEDEVDMLNSLTQVDDYPLYVMHNHGRYRRYAFDPGPIASVVDADLWGCSLFGALGDPENLLFGRNFDWVYSPGLLLFTDPPDGYASVSLQSVRFMGSFDVDPTNLMDTTLDERYMLLYTPLRPYDGMNEAGLAIGMAAVPSDGTRQDPAKEDIDMILAIRKVLDHAANVDQAVEILSQYNIMMEGGPPIHYLIADASGQAVLVEFYNGEMVVIPNEQVWHIATNFFLASAGDHPEDQCWRYNKIVTFLTGATGACSTTEAMTLLEDVSQENTQWSVVYHLSSGEISVVLGRDYNTVHTFQLGMVRE